uniref:Retrotransposon gag domain-containing protein n=1 Tax=Knipowitschia caucasica TaxID=637954 RepID=A0AAV2JHZ5_KNICA
MYCHSARAQATFASLDLAASLSIMKPIFGAVLKYAVRPDERIVTGDAWVYSTGPEIRTSTRPPQVTAQRPQPEREGRRLWIQGREQTGSSSPEKPKEKTYHQLVVLLKNHFDPKPSEIVQRYKFDSRSRNQNESVMDYVAELRRLAQDWDGPTLLGRGWLEDIQLDWKEVKARREARQVHHVHSGKKTTLREVLCNNEWRPPNLPHLQPTSPRTVDPGPARAEPLIQPQLQPPQPPPATGAEPHPGLMAAKRRQMPGQWEQGSVDQTTTATSS